MAGLPQQTDGSGPVPTTPWPAVGRPPAEGSETPATRWYRLVKQLKRAERDGGVLERPIVSMKRAKLSEEPRGEKWTRSLQ